MSVEVRNRSEVNDLLVHGVLTITRNKKMKKIVFGLLVAIMATVSQASTVSWTALSVFGPDGNKSAGAGYLFEQTSSLTVDSVKAILAGDDAGAAATYFANNSFSSVVPTTAGSFSGPKVEHASGDATFFAVLFDAATIADATSFYVTSAVTVTVPGSGNKAVGFGNLSTATSAAGAYTSAGWATGTPEPTSGMLLLLGGALLALRRKQK